MKIEILFPEFCNLYGDISNIKYLKKCLSNQKVKYIETSFDMEPSFVTQDINFIYLGPMTENRQEKVIKKLMPYKKRIEELIEKNTVFLFTGNALEILGKYIENEDGIKIEALGIFDVYAERNMMHRHNSLFIGEYNNIKVVGFKSQFTMMYGNNTDNYFLKVEKGIGINKESKLEGINKNNFFGTYLTGPILILNPLFTKKILQIMGVDKPKLYLEKDLKAAYEERLRDFYRVPYMK